MDQLWSPWRSEYIARTSQPGSCFLCEAAQTTEPSFNNLVVAQTTQVVVLLNRFPYNAGHLLVAPVDHEGDLTKLSTERAAALMHAVQWSAAVLQGELKPHGINIGANMGTASGAGVPDHLHIHLVPRWNGDTNFMPVLAEVKVISENLHTMWERLGKAFSRTSPPSP